MSCTTLANNSFTCVRVIAGQSVLLSKACFSKVSKSLHWDSTINCYTVCVCVGQQLQYCYHCKAAPSDYGRAAIKNRLAASCSKLVHCKNNGSIIDKIHYPPVNRGGMQQVERSRDCCNSRGLIHGQCRVAGVQSIHWSRHGE